MTNYIKCYAYLYYCTYRGVVGLFFLGGGARAVFFRQTQLEKNIFRTRTFQFISSSPPPPPSTTFLVKKISGQERYNCFRSTFSELALGGPAYMQVCLTTKIPTTLPIFRRVSTIGGGDCPPPGATVYLLSLDYLSLQQL